MNFFPNKIILIFGIILLLLGGYLKDQPVKAQTNPNNEDCSGYDRLLKCLTEKIADKMGADLNQNFTNVFEENTDKPKFKNLYFQIYKSLQQEPADQALKEIADRYQYTPQEIKAILSGSLAVLYESQDNTVSNKDAFQLAQQMQEEYQEAFNDAERQQTMILDTYPKEIFANNNTNDSGFDLLYDLNTIETILFTTQNANATTASTGSLSFNSANDSSQESSNLPNQLTTLPPTTTQENASNSTASTDTPPSSSQENSLNQGQSTSQTKDEPTNETISDTTLPSLDPSSCLTDENLQTSFTKATSFLNTDQPTSSNSTNSTSSPQTPPSSNSSSNPNSTTQTSNNLPTESSTTNQTNNFGTSDLATEESRWKSPQICDSIFCLKIRFVNEPETTYEKTTNCIQCHVEHILKILKDTVSISLAPGKLSGNLMEPALCKKSLFSSKINLNFIAVPMPIRTPPADDLVIGLSFCNELKDLAKDSRGTFYGLIFDSLCNKENPGEPATISESERLKLAQFTQNTLNEKTQKAVSNAPVSASTLSIFEEALNAQEAELAATKQNFRDLQTQAQMASSTTDFYQAMSYEMDQMNAYFESYKILINTLRALSSEMEKNLKLVE